MRAILQLVSAPLSPGITFSVINLHPLSGGSVVQWSESGMTRIQIPNLDY